MLGGLGDIGERYLKRGYTKFVKGKKELGIWKWKEGTPSRRNNVC